MRMVLQRVSSARVSVDQRLISEIGPGFLILLGVGHTDAEAQAKALAGKVANLRIFEDEAGKMNRSILETGGQVIVVSQFTLYADTRRGRRPSFTGAAPPELASPLVEHFINLLNGLGIPTQGGEFGAHMLVELANDGPVTILLEV